MSKTDKTISFKSDSIADFRQHLATRIEEKLPQAPAKLIAPHPKSGKGI